MKVTNQIKYCTEPTCSQKFVQMFNPKTKRFVPVDYSSLSSDEKMLIEMRQATINDASIMLCYNGNHHISHFKTCTKPDLFSKN